jgi:glycosyltransferase involved in cell wall biosynthesis
MDGDMRVGLYANRIARPTSTGVGTYIAELSAALADSEHHQDLFLFSLPERRAMPADAGGLPVRYLPWPRALTHLLWSTLGRPRIVSLAGKLDLVHILVPSVPVPTRLPVVGTIHDLTPLTLPGCFDLRTRWLVGRSLRQLARQARRIITVSERTRRDACALLGLPPERVVAIQLGLPRDARRQGEPAIRRARERFGLGQDPYVLFVGEVTRRKNPLALVEAFARLAHELPTCQLVFAGSPGLGADAVRRRVTELRLQSRARLLGHVERETLLGLFSGAAVVALPSLYEGFGIPALEAMACGAPVVVSDGGALPEVVGEAGLVVPGAAVGDLASALLAVLRDETTAHRLRALGQRRAGDFTWKRAAERTLAVYAEALTV